MLNSLKNYYIIGSCYEYYISKAILNSSNDILLSLFESNIENKI